MSERSGAAVRHGRSVPAGRGRGSAAGPVLVWGVPAVVVAAVAATATACFGEAAGIGLEVSGARVPWSGFMTLSVLGALPGLVLAIVLDRVTTRARTIFLRTTSALAALSFVPSLLAPAALPTRSLLVLTHVVAAAIVIPVVAAQLRDGPAQGAPPV